MADMNDDPPITRSVLREEFTAFAQNLMPAFQAMEDHIEATETKLLTEIHRLDTKIDDAEARLSTKIDGVEARLDSKIDGVESRLDSKIAGVGARLDTKIDGVEARLTQRIEISAVSFRKLEADVASLTRRMEDVERKLNPSQ